MFKETHGNLERHENSYYRTRCRIVKVIPFPETLEVYVQLEARDYLEQPFPLEAYHYFDSAVEAMALAQRLEVDRYYTVEGYLVMYFVEPHESGESKNLTPTLYEAVYDDEV